MGKSSTLFVKRKNTIKDLNYKYLKSLESSHQLSTPLSHTISQGSSPDSDLKPNDSPSPKNRVNPNHDLRIEDNSKLSSPK